MFQEVFTSCLQKSKLFAGFSQEFFKIAFPRVGYSKPIFLFCRPLCDLGISAYGLS